MTGAVIFSAFLLLITIDAGLCMSCYLCIGDKDSNCAKNPSLNIIVPCQEVMGIQVRCVKAVAEAKTDSSIWTLRACLPKHAGMSDEQICSEALKKQQRPGDDKLLECQFCNSHLCNGAAGTAASLILAAITSGALAYFVH